MLSPLACLTVSVVSLCPPQGGEDSASLADLGPYPVGVRTLVLVDESRADAYAGGPRTLVTEVWYPATARARKGRPTTFSDFFGEHRDAAAQFVEHFGGEIEAVNRRFRSVGVRGAPRRRGAHPLLVFSHGNGGLRHQNVFQADHLASHGYIVAAPDHTGNAGVTPLPKQALRYDSGGRSRSAVDRPLDVSFVITHLVGESGRRGSWLRGAVDADKIGVLGHSFGGLTACKVAESDARVKAILPMTVAVGRSTTVPLLLMLGSWDRTVGAPGNRLAGTYYDRSDGPKHMVVLKRAGHFTFSDMDRINPRFGDGIGDDRETGEPCLQMDRAKQIINIYTRAFFDHYLRGEAQAGALLTRNVDPAEIELRNGDS